MTALVDLHAVSYRRAGRALVEHIDLSIGAGAVTVIIGPNGAGKSTLLRLISGELTPSEGMIFVDSERLGGIPAWQLASRRAIMSQHSSLAFPFTAFEVARLGAEGIGRGLSRHDRDRIACEALDRADVAPLALRLFQTLSGGEQQRVHFARVLAQLAAGSTVARRQMLLLDEPTASLDLKHQLALLSEARHLARDGLAVVAVLHDLQLAASTADHLVVLASGRIVAEGPPDTALSPDLIASVFEVRPAGAQIPTLPWLQAHARPQPHAGERR